MDSDRGAAVKGFEAEVEVVVVHQLDLVAQLEAQLRAVHHTMRGLEKLRNARYRRPSPELSLGQRSDTLRTVESEIREIDENLQVQHQSCLDMLRCIREMQARLRKLAPAPAHHDRGRTDGSEGSPQA